MDENQLTKFLEEEKIQTGVKIEDFLAPYLELRPCSHLYIPTGFCDALELGQKIDDEVRPQVLRLQQIQDPQAKAIGIQAINKQLERKFEEVVESSESYSVHMYWGDNLKLKSSQAKVRPTVHEIYFYKERETRRECNQVINKRNLIRQKIRNDPSKKRSNLQFAFPEEFDQKWLEKLGKLLGYPECCVKYYAKGREDGVSVEARAAKELLDALKEGEVDAHAYFASNFLPCSPQCSKALDVGHQWQEVLRSRDSRLAELFEQTLISNATLVLRQPELVARFLEQFKTPKKPESN